MTARWAWRRIATGLLAVLLSPILAAILSAIPGVQGADPPTPFVSLSVPTTPLIGQDLGFDVSFSNTSGTQVGYGPYVDISLPIGADGNDGLTFLNATYLTSAVTATQLTVVAGCITHPYALQASGAPVQMCGLVNGSSYVVLRLPFGSFTPGQPAATVHVTTHLSNLADAGTALAIGARGGFQFGATPLNDYATDPSIIGNSTTTNVTPTIIRVTKTYNGPEDETATGPNFPRSYTINVTVAPGQPVTDLTIADVLPNNIQYLSTNPPGVAFRSITEPSTSTPGGTLTINFGDVTGTGGVDATATFNFYVPRVDGSTPTPAVILPATTGAFNTSTDSVTASGSWQPIDIRDSLTVVSAGPATHTLTDKSIAIQKSVALVTDTGPTGASSGDTLEWTLQVQVSDYFALNGVIVDDLLGDGTQYDNSFTPTLSFAGNPTGSATAGFDSANYTNAPVADGTTGKTAISFRLSAELITRGQNGRMVGGCVDPAGIATPDCSLYNNGGTTATIKFRSVIRQTYVATGAEVVEGDTLHNQASAAGNVLNTNDFSATGNNIGDGTSAMTPAGTSASITIDRGTLEKTIYAINGSTVFSQPVHVSPGDAVTYRLKQTFPTSRTDDFRITDYLPLPVFYASGVTFDAVMDATAPAAGHAKYGPADTFHDNCNSAIPAECPDAPTPVVTFDGTANSLEFAYGNYALYPPAASTADILFTVTVSTSPFADGLLLTNQARSQTRNAVGTLQTADAIIQITLDQPVLGITKGVVRTDNAAGIFSPVTTGPVAFSAVAAPPSVTCPGFTGSVTTAGLGTNPIDSNLTGVDAGDYVRFAIVVQNTGHSAAYDVKVQDTLPAGFVVPAGGLDLCVSSGVGGVGSDIAYANIGAGTGLLDLGIQLNGSGSGALAAGVSGSGVTNATGSNIAVITYTLKVDTSAVPQSVITNTATLSSYANDPGAANHMSSPLTDTATVTIGQPVMAKILSATSEPTTLTTSVAVGEIATYQITVTVPEGTMPVATVVDTLPAGLVPVDCSPITASAGVASSTVTFGNPCVMGVDPTVAGQVVTFNFGTLINSNSSNGTPETIVITYRVVVTNVATNIHAHTLNNAAALSWTGGSLAPVNAGNITVVEPSITTAKTSDITTGDSGDMILYTITLTNLNTGGNRADAFEVTMTDVIPAGLTYDTSIAPFTQTSGPATTSMTVVGSTLTAKWDTLAQGAVAVFQFHATIDLSASPGTRFTNTANTDWSSLPGNITTTQSTYSGVATERTGNVANPGLALNNYRSFGARNVDVPLATTAKTMTATNQAHTTGTNVAIGEILTYELVLTIPEGTMPSAQLVDTLDPGLAFVNCISIATNKPADVTGTFTSACNAPTNPVITVSGQVVTFNLGTITNANTDNAAPAETITITYRAVVTNVGTNLYSPTTSLNNSAALSWTGHAATVVSAPVVTVVEPIMTIGKSPSPATGDAGDLITFTITVANPSVANNTDAFEVVWTDAIPTGLTYVPGSLQCTAGTCPVLNASLAPVLSGTWTSFGLDATAATITYQATLDGDVPSGSSYTNTAQITWTSLPTDQRTALSNYFAASTERTGSAGDPGGAANTYKQTAQAIVSVPQPTPTKTLVVTSEGGTVDPYVVVGEIARFRVKVVIPEGITPTVTITDQLPTGLRYLDGTTKVAFVTNGGGAGITSSVGALSGAGLAQTGDASWNLAPTFDMPPGQITGGASDGAAVTFAFGNLTNADRDLDAEMIVIEFNVLVDNVGTNTTGVGLTDQATVYSNAVALAPAGTATITVAEPAITLTKSITTTPTDGGDTIVYHIAITNGSGASVSPAYEVHVTDTLDGNLTPVGFVPGGASVITANASSGQLVDLTFDAIAPGATETIDITATVIGTVDAGTVIPNTATATWTSEPGLKGTTSNATGGSTPGASGTATGERDGSGGINTYHATSAVSVTMAKPSIAKAAAVAPNLPVGGTTTFDLTVTLPEGTTRALIVTDTLPAGLTAISSTVISGSYSGTLSTPTEIPVVGDAGGAWTWNFGDTYLAPASAGHTFTIRITVRVANVAANIKGKVLTNSAGLAYQDPSFVPPQTVAAPQTRNITVLEPKLKVTKTVSANTPHFGATVTYTIKVEHQAAALSNSTAYDVVVTDTLPAGLTLQTGTLTHVAGAPGGQAADTATAVGSTVTLTYNSLAFGTTSSYTFDAVVGSAPTYSIGQTLTNTATTTWTSMSGAVYERTGNPADPGGALNNYTIGGSVGVNITGADMSLVKTHTGSMVAGGVITFHLAYHNGGNQQATGVVLTETVPTGSTYSGSGWVCPGGFTAGNACTRAIGTVAAGATTSVDFAVTVVNPIPSGLVNIDNTASVADDGTHGADPTPLNNTSEDIVVGGIADLSLTKTVDDATPDAGQVVVFTIRVSNAGPVAATNVTVTDTLSAGLTYFSNSVTQGSYNSGTGVWTVGTVANGGSQTLTLRATVTTPGLHTNVAEVSHSDQRDPNSTPGNAGLVHEDDDASASVTPNVADLGVTKSAAPAHPDLNSTVTFTIVAHNYGPNDATGVVVTDVLPAGLTYDPSTSATAGTYDPATHKWTIGALANGASQTLTLKATVTSLGTITNTATITGDPFDPDMSNNTASVSTSQLVDLAVTKVVDHPTANVGTQVVFTITVQNLGPGSATSVVILDLLPAGLTYVSSVPSQGTYDPSTGHWDVGTIAADGLATLDIHATVVASVPTTNTASVFSLDEPQSDLTNDSASATVTPPHSDLQLTKTVTTQRPNTGDKDTFTITVTNAGPDMATNVYVMDLLPAGLNYDAPTAWGASQGSFDTVTGRWDVGDLDNGASATLTLYIVVTTAGDYTNSATATGDQYDPTPGNNTDSASLSTRIADIGVDKVADNPTPNVGTTVTYTVTVTNYGPDGATQLVIHDQLPAGLTYVSNTPSVGSYDPITGDWTIGVLAKDGVVTLTIRARVVGSGIIDNTAAVSHLLQRDLNPDNDSSTAEIDVPPAADLSLTKTVDNGTPDKGTNITFTITVTNHGPNGTTGVHVGDPLPAGVTWISDVPSVGTYDHTTGDWTIGDMANGDTVTLTITVTVDVEGPITNTAQVTASSVFDPNSTPNNNAPGEDDQASAQVNSRGVADLQVVKTVSPTSVHKGQHATYTIVLTNNGPDGATGVIIRDQLPAGVTYVSSSGGDYNATTGAWTVGSLGVGSSTTLTVVVLVGQTGTIHNTAEVAACDQRDPNPDNNVDSADLAAAGATPPPTSVNNAGTPLGGPGSLLPWLLGLAFASMALMAAAALTARNRRLRARLQRVPLQSSDRPVPSRRPRRPGL